MRTRQKIRLTLTALTAVLLLGVYLWLLMEERHGGEGDDSLCIYTLEASSIERLTFTGADGLVALRRQDDRWVWEQEEDFPLNQNFTGTMVAKTAALWAKRAVAEGEEHFAVYGLDQPSNVITVTAGDQKKVIYLGSANSASGDYYMALEGSGKIYTVDASFYNIFSGSILSMAVRESLPDFTIDDMIQVTVTEGEQEIIFARETKSNGAEPGRWLVWSREEGEKSTSGLVEPPVSASPGDETLVSRLLAQIPKLRYEELAAYHPDGQELEARGLGNHGARLQVLYQKNGIQEIYSLLIGDETGGYRFVYPENGQGIYKVSASSLSPFQNLAAEAYLSLSVAQVRREELEGITISGESFQTEYTLESQPDGSVLFYHDKEEITEKEFNSIYFPLYSLTAEKRVTDIAGQLTRPGTLTINYRRLSGLGEDILVELIAYDQNYYAARVNGKAELLVNRQRVNGILELWK